MEFDTHELAWAAGFFDGEGCTNFNSSKGVNNLSISIQQKDVRVLDRFKHIFPFVKIRTYVGSNGNIYNEIRVSKFEYAQAIMAMMWKYLGIVKRTQYLGAVKGFLFRPSCTRVVNGLRVRKPDAGIKYRRYIARKQRRDNIRKMIQLSKQTN